MKKHVLALSAFLLSAGSAIAADPIYPAEPMAPVAAAPLPFSWTGFFIGAHLGYGWSDAEWTLIDNAGPGGPGGGAGCGRCGTVVTTSDADGFLGGLQAGFNYQMSNGFVVGAEAEIAFSNLDGEGRWIAGSGAERGTRTAALDLNWLGTVGPRIGFAADQFLLYAEGGFAFADLDYEHRNLVNGNSFSSSDTTTGWFIGGGLEYAFADNWSAKIEYNYVDLGSEKVSLAGARGNDEVGTAIFDVDHDMHVVKAGLNYRF